MKRSLENQTAEVLPKQAALCRQWVRCGRTTCPCAFGQLHGPYFYYFYRVGGRLVKRYVRKGEAPAILAALQEQRTLRDRLRQGWRRFRRLREQEQEAVNGGE